MDKNNVVPIDQSTERLLARRQRRFHWLVGALTTTWLAVLVAAVALTPLPPVVPFAILAVLVVLAEHRFVLFGDETSMSGSMIVIVASVFVFADTSPIVGPLLIASLGGLYVPHLRARAWGLAIANPAIFCLSALSSALVVATIAELNQTGMPQPLWALVAASATYWLANSALTGIAAAVRNQEGIRQSVCTQTTSQWPVIFLVISAALIGTWGTESPLALPSIGILALLQTDRLPTHLLSSQLWRRAFLIGGCIGVLAIGFRSSPPTGALLFVGLYIFCSGGWICGRQRWFLVAIGAATLVAVALNLLAVPRPVGLWITATAVSGILLTSIFFGPGEAKSRVTAEVPVLVRLGLFLPTTRGVLALAVVASLFVHGAWYLEVVPQIGAVLLLVAVTEIERSRCRSTTSPNR